MKKNIKELLSFVFGVALVIFLPKNVVNSYQSEGFSLATFWNATIVIYGVYLIISSILIFYKYINTKVKIR